MPEPERKEQIKTSSTSLRLIASPRLLSIEKDRLDVLRPVMVAGKMSGGA